MWLFGRDVPTVLTKDQGTLGVNLWTCESLIIGDVSSLFV